MLYVCPRCSYQTNIYQKYCRHITKRVKCINVNEVNDNLNLLDYGKIPSRKKIIKIEVYKYSCSVCNSEFKSKSSAYKHFNETHKFGASSTNDLNWREQKIQINTKKNIVENNNFTNINQKNYISNNYIIINGSSSLNCFGNESFEHIDKLLLLNAIFNYDLDKTMKEKNILSQYTPHTINVFVKIHLELLKCPQNLNCYIQGYYSNSVTYLNEMYELENDTTDNAIYARVKTIYERTMDVYKDIHRNYPNLFLEIYDKYNSLIHFEFTRYEYDKMLKYLTNTLSDLFELYKHSNFTNQNEEKRLSNTFKSHLFDVRTNTKKYLLNIESKTIESTNNIMNTTYKNICD